MLSLQTFGPWPASLRMAVVQGGRHNLRGQLEVIAETLDALVGEVPVEVVQANCSFTWPHDLKDCMKLEPIIQSEVSQKGKYQYSILMHIYGI